MRLSIVTVCRNNLTGLIKTRESILAQTWRDFEWIVVDGASADGTVPYLRGLSNPPDKWVSEPDGGIYDAMNKGLGMAAGEYVLFLNSGDTLSRRDSLLALMEPRSSADVVYGDINHVSNGRTCPVRYTENLDQESLILEGLPHPSAAIKTEVLRSAGGYDTSYKIAADFKSWLQLFKKGRRFEHRPKTVTDFALGGVSSMNPAQDMKERQRAIREVFGVADAPAVTDASGVVVVVPVYRRHPTASETLSLRRSFSVLRDYSIVLCHPEGLDVSEYDELAGRTLDKTVFAAEFFRGLDGYNDLMVSPDFYRRFSQYEYLLICQPDAWIFRDELRQWCAKGYDYIGAPIFGLCHTHESGERFWATGNGGLSLRRVKRFVEITESGIPARTMKEFGWSEDCVFSIALKSTECALNAPLPLEAANFSFEKSPAYLHQLTGFRLPFGCHGWAKYDFHGFWSRYIPYVLSEDELAVAEHEKRLELECVERKLAETKEEWTSPCENDSDPVRFTLRWLRGQVKQFVPYGLILLWMRVHHGEEIEGPVRCCGFGRKRLKRIVKFTLPYGLVMEWRRSNGEIV